MGTVTRRQQLIIVPNKYWTSTASNIDLITKESDAKTKSRNKAV